MEAIDPILNIADKAGVVVMLLFGGLALHRRWIVLGWYYDELRDQLATCGIVNSAYSTKMETRLDKLESEKDKRDGNVA